MENATRSEADVTSPEAEEGRFLHAAVWDPDMRRDCDADGIACLEVIDAFMDAHDVDWEGEVALKITDSDPFMVSTLTWGTVDAVGIRDDGTAVIADWKMGRVEVPDPAVNLQLAAYACAVMQEYGVDAVDAYIVQPRVRRENHPHWRFTKPWKIVERIQRIIAAGEAPGLDLRTGSHCRYCTAQVGCSALNLESSALVKTVESGLDRINPGNAAEAHDQASLIRKAADQVLAHVKQLAIDAGGQIPGLEIQEVQGHRMIPDPQKAYTALAEFINHEEFMALVQVSPAKAEDLLARKGKESGRFKTIKEGKEYFASLGLTERKPATRKLVRNAAISTALMAALLILTVVCT
jgi:hypothetical protein